MNENMITVTGNLCADPEGRQTRSGADMVTFRVASTHRYFSNRNGEWEEGVTNYYDVVAYRQLAQNAGKSLRKGDAVILQGQFKQRRFERQDGSTGMGCEIEARIIGPDLAYGVSQFLRRPRGQGNGQSGQGQGAQGQGQGAHGQGQRQDPWRQPGSNGSASNGSGSNGPGSNGSGSNSSGSWVDTDTGEISEAPVDPHRTGYEVQRDHEPLETYPARGGEDSDGTDVGDGRDAGNVGENQGESAPGARSKQKKEDVKEPVS